MSVYSDIDQKITLNDYGDIIVLIDEESIKQSIKNIILTNVGERARFQNPFFGSKINNSLGEKINNVTALQISDEIETALENWDNRIIINEVKTNINIDKQLYEISIFYTIKNLNIDGNVNFILDVLK